MTELGGLNGRIAPAIALLQRVEEPLHHPFDLHWIDTHVILANPVVRPQGVVSYTKRNREFIPGLFLSAIARHRVADRPDRFEPRMAKRRPKNYVRLTKPRKQIKLEMLKRLRKI
jgi:hypothetical protein